MGSCERRTHALKQAVAKTPDAAVESLVTAALKLLL